jgi:anti-sigma-K factor RskA
VLRPAVAARCAVALVAAGGGLGVHAGGGSDDARSPPQPPAEVLTLDPVDGAEPSAGGRVLVRDDGGEHATLRVSGLAPVPGHFYELWLLGADGQLVALGSFPVDASGTARIDVPLPVDAADFRFFDVSLEAEDGDPGHSGMSVLRGATSA